MGCGASRQVGPDGEIIEDTTRRPQKSGGQSRHHLTNGHANEETRQNNKATKLTIDTNANRQDVSTNNGVKKSIAFDVMLDDNERKKDSLIMKHPPLKLKRLEPLDVPTLTPEMLTEKQRLAEEKRIKELQRKASASRRSSKRRRDLMQAKEFEKQQQQEQEIKILEQQKTADKLREARLLEIKEKQRIREERARRTREKAKKLTEGDQEDLGGIDVEKDENFNADDVDSWLDGSNNNSDADERIYSGRTSPRKFYNENSNTKPPPSASTIDSFDNAFNRKPPSASAPRHPHLKEERDDFFDS